MRRTFYNFKISGKETPQIQGKLASKTVTVDLQCSQVTLGKEGNIHDFDIEKLFLLINITL